MAHIVNALADEMYRTIIPGVFEVAQGEESEHEVTTIHDPWELVALVRSTLHGLIIIFNDDGRFDGIPDDLAEALLSQREALHRHAFLHICWHEEPWPLPPPLQVLYDELGVELLRAPFPLDDLLAAVDRAAARLSGHADTTNGRSLRSM